MFQQFRFEPEDIWENVTPQAKQFISSLLVTNPKNRPSAEAAQQSAWLQEWANNALNSNGGRSLNPNVVQALVSFKEYSDMRKLLCEVLSFTLLPSQIEDLRKEFEKFDTEGRGEITLDSLKQVLMHSAGTRSLGSLSEGEVEDIFNAMRVRKSDTTIQWHEFIAAGLSQCDVDDRNLRLAFDRLDSDHKGYISFDDVLDLMGCTSTEESIRTMFQDSLQLCRSKHARLSYEDFLHLMKGQTYEDAIHVKHSPVVHSPVISHRRGASLVNMDDGFFLGESALPDTRGTANTLEGVPFIPLLSTQLSQVEEDKPFQSSLEVVAEVDYFSDQEVVGAPSSLGEPSVLTTASFADKPPLSGIPSLDKRGRSKSYDEHDSHPEKEEEEVDESTGKLKGITDSRRCILLPEHTLEMHEEPDVKDSIASVVSLDASKKTALAANRELYRAHRRMRLAVLEASKRFEENQTLRTKMQLQQVSDGGAEPLAKTNLMQSVSAGGVAAGLTMKHGNLIRQDSAVIREQMEKLEKEKEEKLQQAYKKAGRGKKKRNKTVSDMTAMMALVSQPEAVSKSIIGLDASGIEDDDAVALVNIQKNSTTWTGPVSSVVLCCAFVFCEEGNFSTIICKSF